MVLKKTGLSINVPDKNDPMEKAFQKVMEDEDAAQGEVDQWIKSSEQPPDAGAGLKSAALQLRIQRRFEVVKKSYDEFLQHHPDHARGHLAYGSFLSDLGEESAARDQWE